MLDIFISERLAKQRRSKKLAAMKDMQEVILHQKEIVKDLLSLYSNDKQALLKATGITVIVEKNKGETVKYYWSYNLDVMPESLKNLLCIN